MVVLNLSMALLLPSCRTTSTTQLMPIPAADGEMMETSAQKKSNMNTMNPISIPPASAFTIPEIQKFRDVTAGTKNVIHFNNAGSGLMPDLVTRAQIGHL